MADLDLVAKILDRLASTEQRLDDHDRQLSTPSIRSAVDAHLRKAERRIAKLETAERRRADLERDRAASDHDPLAASLAADAEVDAGFRAHVEREQLRDPVVRVSCADTATARAAVRHSPIAAQLGVDPRSSAKIWLGRRSQLDDLIGDHADLARLIAGGHLIVTPASGKLASDFFLARRARR